MVNPFEDAILDLRISGSIVLHETYLPPWAIDIPPASEIRQMLGAPAVSQVVPFHLVRRGRFELQSQSTAPLLVEEGQVALCPGGNSHRMIGGKTRNAVALRDLVTAGESPIPRGDADGCTELVCGAFILNTSSINPILAALPHFMMVSVRKGEADPLLVSASEMLMLNQAHSAPEHAQFNVARVLEIFCAEAIRSHARSSPKGWFRSLDDPKILAALQHVHQQPGQDWTVERLAGIASLSPSRFAARFRDAVGETVLAYVTRWRMIIACRRLEDKAYSLDKIAHELGYGSPSAFSRAFKHTVGMSPSHWRIRGQ